MADTIARTTGDGRSAEMPLVEPSATTGLFEVFRRRYLLKLLVRREIAARYQGSFLGMIWSYINPLSQFFMFYVVIGIIMGIGNVSLKFSDNFSLSGIALGTIVAIAGYHLAKAVAPRELRDRANAPGGAAITVGGRETYGDSDGVDDLYQDDRRNR